MTITPASVISIGGCGYSLAARSFERIAAFLDLAAQIAGLAGDAEQLLERLVIRLELVIRDAPVLDRHRPRGNRCGAVAFDQTRAQLRVVFGPAKASGRSSDCPRRQRPRRAGRLRACGSAAPSRCSQCRSVYVSIDQSCARWLRTPQRNSSRWLGRRLLGARVVIPAAFEHQHVDAIVDELPRGERRHQPAADEHDLPRFEFSFHGGPLS